MGSGTLVQMVAKGYGANYITDLAFYTATSGGTNSLPAMYITSSNKIGILTGTPSTTFDVNGTGNFSSTLTVSGQINITGAGTAIQLQGTSYGNIAADKTLYLDAGTSSDMYLRTNGGSSRILIKSNGNVLVGSTVDSGYKLEVVGSFKVGGSAYFQGSVYNYVGSNIFFAQGGTINYLYSGAASMNIINQADTATIGTFSGTTGVYTPLSDINKKKDFEQSTIGLDAILNLKPTLYRMIDEEEYIDKHLGFIAQEVKDFIPQAYEESGEEDKKFIGLNYNPIVAALVKAVQELSAQVEELKAKIK
jgi:hypothetical protein